MIRKIKGTGGQQSRRVRHQRSQEEATTMLRQVVRNVFHQLFPGRQINEAGITEYINSPVGQLRLLAFQNGEDSQGEYFVRDDLQASPHYYEPLLTLQPAPVQRNVAYLQPDHHFTVVGNNNSNQQQQVSNPTPVNANPVNNRRQRVHVQAVPYDGTGVKIGGVIHPL